MEETYSAGLELVDIGANLTNRCFEPDREQILQRAREAGVSRIIVTGTSVNESEAASDLARNHPRCLSSTAGVHPHDASGWNETTAHRVRSLATRPEVVAVGETGLDFNRNYSPPAAQEAAFRAQLTIAAELHMPVFVHERDAHSRLVQILAPFLPSLPGAVIHCFTGDERELDRYLELGLFVGITGWICDERRGQHLKQLLKRIPDDRLMLETDAPYLLPRDLVPKPRSRRNEPAYLPHVLRAVAMCREHPVEAVARATTETALKFFQIETPRDARQRG